MALFLLNGPALAAITRHAAKVADRVGLPLHVGEERRVVGSLQPFPDQGPQDNLKAHREPERDGRLSGQDPSPIQEFPGEREEDPGLMRERHVAPSRGGPRPFALTARRAG